MIGYEDVWFDLKKTLIIKLNDLESLAEKAITERERERLKAKIQGLKIAVQDIFTLQKMYGLCRHDNAVIDGNSARDMYCPECNTRFKDCSI